MIKILLLQKKQGTVAPCFLMCLIQDYILADNSLPALNLATFFALILITAPV